MVMSDALSRRLFSGERAPFFVVLCVVAALRREVAAVFSAENNKRVLPKKPVSSVTELATLVSEVGLLTLAIMERDIRRLEQAVEESIRCLGSWRSRREEASGHVSPPTGPDGASAPRRRRPVATDARAMLHGLPLSTDTLSPRQRAVTPATPAKVPKYNGLTPLEPYLSQVRLAARHNGWSDEEAATHLALALEGDALQVLFDLAPSEQHELQTLTIALERRFGQRHATDQSREQLTNRSRRPGESLGTFAADVLLHARRGYPEFPAAAREELSLHAFLRGLFPERLRQHVRLAMPQTLREALLEAERAELVFTSQPNQQVPPPNYPQIRVADCDGEGEVAEICQLQPSVPRRRLRRPTDRCYRTCPEDQDYAASGKRGGSGVVRGPPLQLPAPLQGRCTVVGRVGHLKGLYLSCCVEDLPCQALVDTGSTISLIRPGVLPGTSGPLVKGWSPTDTQLMTVTGERADMRGKKPLRVRVKDLELVHDFWLADIQDQCIIGLDLLTRWGACVDTAKRAITLGTETLAFQCGQKQGAEGTRARRDRRQAAAAQQISGAGGSGSSLLTSAPASQPDKSPSTETTEAVGDLWQRSSVGLNVDQHQRLRCLLDENVDIFATSDKDCRQTGLVQHTIDTGSAQPIRLRPHRLPLSKRQVAEEKIREMAAAGVIEPSNSPWAAPVVLVGKKDGSPRFCVDFRHLNAVTKKDSYPLPRIDEALDYVTGSSWFSSLDLRSGYWQVELAPEARPKTAFTIGQGLWQFRVMPFGLCNAPATFERLMERVLVNIPRSRCVVYLDDLLVHGGDFDSALSHLSEVFSAIRRAGLRLNPAKCRLLARETTFLGHVISAQGIATDSAKVAAVRDWPTPSNVKELRSFLGLASYYRRFIKGFATIASPLHRLTDKGQPFGWGDACAAAFAQLKEALTRAPVLAYPDARQPFIVDTDASNVGVGAVLSQQGEAGERVVAYFSCALGRAERNYCVTWRELLAVVLAVRHFRPYLHGCRFLLRTDHASLTWLLNFKHPEGRVACWLEVLQGYDFEIQHRAGRQHGNADALSRRPCMAVECRYCLQQEERAQEALGVATAQATASGGGWLPLTTQQLKREQEADATLGQVGAWLEAAQRPDWTEVSGQEPEVKAYYSQHNNLETHDGLLYRRWRAPGQGRDLLQLLVPRALRSQVLELVHGSVGAGHYGTAKTLRRLRGRFYWPGCRRDVELHVHCCDTCTAQKGPTQRSTAPLQQYLVGAPMERVGVDVLGPFPVTESGNRYVLVAMDYFTKWPEAYTVPDQSATTTAERLVEEMFARFGVPAELHSDQGRNFESKVFGEICRRLGMEKTRTTPLHPQSDGLVERFNRTLATQLAILTSRHQRDWDRHLPLVLWSYRTAVQESSQCTPAALMFGRELRTPVDLVFGSPPEPEIDGGPEMDYYRRLRERLQVVHDYTRQAQASAGVRQKRAYDTKCRGEAFVPGDKVWVYCPVCKRGVSPKLCSHWQGPAEVVERLTEVVYRIRMPGPGRMVVLHRDRLSPYRPLAPADAGAGDAGDTPGSDPSDFSPAGRDRPVRQKKAPGHLQDFVWGNGAVGDD
ncbi:hypothetical protein ACER0C_003718 [Sarotherodon galilaeus]